MSETILENNFGQQIKSLDILVEKRLNTALKEAEVGLTGQQVVVLTLIHHQQGAAVTQKQIEVTLHLSHPTTRGIVKRLMTAGLVASTPDPRDRRQVLLTLTTAGEQVMAAQRPLMDRLALTIEERMLAGIPASQRQALRGLLHQMIQNLADD